MNDPYEYEEHAAIKEYLANLPREQRNKQSIKLNARRPGHWSGFLMGENLSPIMKTNHGDS